MPTKAWLLIVLGWSAAALAVDPLVPYASVAAEYNSNIFDLPAGERIVTQSSGSPLLDPLLGTIGITLPGQQPAAQNGTEPRSDTMRRYIAGIDVTLLTGNQTLRATVEGRRVDFAHYAYLDHNEYLFSGGLDWSLSQSVDGALAYRQERRRASFADRVSTALTIETKRIGTGSVHLNLNPEWRLEGGLRARQLDSPLPGFPNFSLKENAVNSAIKYLGVETLAAGLYAEYLKGKFDGISNAGKFHQESLALTTDYSSSDLSRFHAELGYTRRQDEDNASAALSAVTGTLSYHRELSAKTKAELQVFRRVESYVGGASSIKDTGAAAQIAWQATDKILLVGAYQRAQSQFEQSAGTANPDRKDNNQLASLKLTYQLLQWLALRPYGEYQARDSNIRINSFHAAIAGIELSARFE